SVTRGRLGQGLERRALSGGAKLLVALPVGLGDLLLGGRHRVSGVQVTVKCASTGFPALPLIGRMSCGQAENAMTRSISARNRTYPPGSGLGGGAKASMPSGAHGIFMNRLSGLGTSGGVKPSACIPAKRLSVQL